MAASRLQVENVAVLLSSDCIQSKYYYSGHSQAREKVQKHHIAPVLIDPFDKRKPGSFFRHLAIDFRVNDGEEKDLCETVALLIPYANHQEQQNGRNLLAQALDAGRPLGVITALSKHMSSNFQDKEGNSPLKYGIDKNLPDIVNNMLEQKEAADVNAKIGEISVIEYAVEKNLARQLDLAVIKAFLNKEAKVSVALVKKVAVRSVGLAVLLIQSRGFDVNSADQENLLHSMLNEEKPSDEVAFELVKRGVKTAIQENGKNKELLFVALEKKLPKTAEAMLG